MKACITVIIVAILILSACLFAQHRRQKHIEKMTRDGFEQQIGGWQKIK